MYVITPDGSSDTGVVPGKPSGGIPNLCLRADILVLNSSGDICLIAGTLLTS